jgi:hypothetical protein
MKHLSRALLIVFLWSTAADAATRRYAVIVAHNRSLDADVAPLEFADDDGARYWEFFSRAADEVKLFTVLDTASQRLFPEAARAAEVPSRDRVLAGLGQIFARASADVARGDEVVFHFILVGHGEIGAGGEGYVSLVDAPFRRTDLFREVLARSPATTNHVIVDACNAYHLVHRRGGAEDDAAPGHGSSVRAFLAAESVARYPNTGFLLSTSSARESHEWSAYRAGVFSHQLRSALAGAADINGDGRIEYSELEAFVAAANNRVTDPRARVELHTAPPALDASRPVMDLSAARFEHWLGFKKGARGRIYVEDDRGVRYLDAHLSGDRALALALVPRRHYYVRTHDDASEARVSLLSRGRVDVDLRAMVPAALARRGAVSEAFRQHLFAEPYGRAFYDGYMASKDGVVVTPARQRFWPDEASLGRSEIESRIRRLNQAASGDAELARRLRRVASRVANALHGGDYLGAASLLDQAETGD